MDFDSNLTPSEIPKRLPKLKSLYDNLFQGGKCYRGNLVFGISEEMGLPEDQCHLLSRVVEFIHNSSLLHDDIIDETPLRRGKKAAWNEYGSGYAVLAGDYLLARVIKDLCKTKNLDLVEFTSQSILSLVEGEWLQDDCHGKPNVTFEQLNTVHKLKTSSLFSWCFKAPAILKGNVSSDEILKLEELGDLLGALLQRSDDLLDFNIRNSEEKPYFRDSVSGYFNLFMVHCLKNKTEEDKQKVFDIKTLPELVSTLDIDLDQALLEFDEINKELLSKVKGLLNEISSFSPGFKNELLEASKKIYWRS